MKGVKKTASGMRVKHIGSAKVRGAKGGMGLGKAGALVATPAKDCLVAKKMR